MTGDSHPRCWTCDCPLSNLPEHRCPECGRPFDPARRSTVNLTGRPIGFLRRRCLTPPGPIGFPLAILGLLTLWLFRTPDNFYGPINAAFIWLLILAAWALRLAAAR